MRKLEKILIMLIVLGQLMRILDISGGSIISIFSAILLGVFYMLFGWMIFIRINFQEVFRKNIIKDKGNQIAVSILAGITLAFCVLGFVLKLQIIMDANLFLGIGAFLMVVSVFVLVNYWRGGIIYSMIMRRIVAIGTISLILWAIPPVWLVDVFYHRHPEHVEEIKEKIRNSKGSSLFDTKEKKRLDLD